MAKKGRKRKPSSEKYAWSKSARLYHLRSCSAVGRIAKENLKTGNPPNRLKPHDCVTESAAPAIEQPQSNHAMKSKKQAFYKYRLPAHSLENSAPLQKSQSHSSSDGHSETGNALNPYCRCNPCKCEPPCTCGLHKTESTSHTHWDAGNLLLKHTVTDIYRPDPSYQANNEAPSAHNEKSGEREIRMAAVEDAIAQLNSPGSRYHSTLNHFRSDSQQSDLQHHHKSRSVRQAVHKGHTIELVTSYQILIDGEILDIHIDVSPEGRVHCHTIPNYETGSALDLIETIIDAFPDDYPPQY